MATKRGRVDSLPSSIERVLGSRIIGQAVLFAASSAFVSLLAAIAKAVVARELPTASFGSFSFATSFLLFTSLFFEFGVFLPAARLLATERERDKKQIVGAALVLFVPVGLAFVLATLALSTIVDAVFHVHASHALALIAPLALVYPFRQVALWLAQGLDRLHVFSITSAFAQSLFIISLVVVTAAGVSLTTVRALGLQCGALAVGGVLFTLWTRPSFRRTAPHVHALIQGARSYGFHVYVGRVLSIGTYNMDVLMLGAFTTATSVAYYSLAGAIAAGSGFPIIGLSTALFHRMVGRREIERQWLLVAWAVGLSSAALAWLFASPFIDAVFSHRYSPAVRLVAPLAFAQAIRGVTSVYNSFLSAQARGTELRNAGLILTSSNIVLNFALIPPFGAMGAAWASLIALIANLAAHIFYYRRSLPDQSDSGSPPTATSLVVDPTRDG